MLANNQVIDNHIGIYFRTTLVEKFKDIFSNNFTFVKCTLRSKLDVILYHFSNTIFHCVSWMNKRNRKYIWTNLHINRVVLFALFGKSIGKSSILACLNNWSGHAAEAHFMATSWSLSNQRIRVIVAGAVIVSNILVCGRYVCILAYKIGVHIGVVILI